MSDTEPLDLIAEAEAYVFKHASKRPSVEHSNAELNRIRALVTEVRRLREERVVPPVVSTEYRVQYDDGQFDQFDTVQAAEEWSARFDGKIVVRTVSISTGDWKPYVAKASA